MSQVKYDRKSYNKKYHEKLAEQEEYCEACCIKVKVSSMPNHRKGKKHIENEKKNSNDLIAEVIKTAELLKKENPKKNPKDIILELYYSIQAEYFNEDGDEIIPEEDFFSKPETKTKEEEAFCAQSIADMNFEISDLMREIEYSAPLSFLESLDAQIDKVDATTRTAKKDLLHIYRRIMNQKSSKDASVQEPKMPIKTIEEPKASKPILKKKVEIVVEEESYSDNEEVNQLDKDFIPVSRFYKMDVKEKQEHLEFLLNNYMGFFDNYYEDLADAYESVEHGDEYLVIYKKMVEVMVDKREECIAEEEEEDDN